MIVILVMFLLATAAGLFASRMFPSKNAPSASIETNITTVKAKRNRHAVQHRRPKLHLKSPNAD
jgi:hypothetical protein